MTSFGGVGVQGLLIVAIAVVALFYFWKKHLDDSAEMVLNWSKNNGFLLISAKYCWFYRGPFWLSANKNQAVYRIHVRDSRGQNRSGWVRCGGWFRGLASQDVVVRWDAES